MGIVSFYDRFRKVTRIMGTVSAYALAAIMIFTVIITIFRYVLKIPILGSNEIVEVILSVCIFASIAFGQTEKSHVNLFLILMKLPRTVAVALYSIDMIIATAASGFITYGLFQQSIFAYNKHMITILRGMPLYIFYIIGCICFAVFTFVMLMDTIIVIMGIRNEKMRELTVSNWS